MSTRSLNRKFLFKKRPFLLLEVLIAFALVIFCAIPLISPHVDMYKAQRSRLDKEELDHVVNLLYADILEKMYLNKIDWTELVSESEVPITPDMVTKAGYSKPLYFDGKYKFNINIFKPKKQTEFNLYLFDLTMTFLPTSLRNADPKVKEASTLIFNYRIFVARDLTVNANQPSVTP